MINKNKGQYIFCFAVHVHVLNWTILKGLYHCCGFIIKNWVQFLKNQLFVNWLFTVVVHKKAYVGIKNISWANKTRSRAITRKLNRILVWAYITSLTGSLFLFSAWCPLWCDGGTDTNICDHRKAKYSSEKKSCLFDRHAITAGLFRCWENQCSKSQFYATILMLVICFCYKWFWILVFRSYAKKKFQ